jgi:phosphate transport system substrate-binding protein
VSKDHRHHVGKLYRLVRTLLVGTIAFALGSCATAANELRIGGAGVALGTVRQLAGEFGKNNPQVRLTIVPILGNSGGIKAVADGVIDLAVSSHPLNEGEGKLGVTGTEYARTPFVFAVSTKTSLSAITRRELADIYAGKMMKWADGSAVRVVLRATRDPNSEMVRSLSPEIRQALAIAEQRPGVRFSAHDKDTADDLETIPGAIGASSLALIVSEKRALRALKLDGVEPTPGNAARGAYPYHLRLFFVTRARPTAAVERFIAFVRSRAGRTIIERNGQWIP